MRGASERNDLDTQATINAYRKAKTEGDSGLVARIREANPSLDANFDIVDTQ